MAFQKWFHKIFHNFAWHRFDPVWLGLVKFAICMWISVLMNVFSQSPLQRTYWANKLSRIFLSQMQLWHAIETITLASKPTSFAATLDICISGKLEIWKTGQTRMYCWMRNQQTGQTDWWTPRALTIRRTSPEIIEIATLGIAWKKPLPRHLVISCVFGNLQTLIWCWKWSPNFKFQDRFYRFSFGDVHCCQMSVAILKVQRVIFCLFCWCSSWLKFALVSCHNLNYQLPSWIQWWMLCIELPVVRPSYILLFSFNASCQL